jgi:hypothetical protein
MQQIENYQTVKAHDSMPASAEIVADVTQQHPLDSPDVQKRLNQIEDWWYQARQAQAMSRWEMALDQDFYDGLQWRDEDKLELAGRGQLPLVFNKIKTSVDWIIGSEKRTRVDSKVYPREEGDVQLAEVKTELLKYLSDVNKTGFSRSKAFAEAVIVGVGWLEDAIRNDPTEEPLFSRTESWRNVWYDHLSQEKDLSDARYIFRSKWTDQDIAIAMFPDRAEALRAASRSFDILGNDDDEFYWLNNRMSADGRIISRQSYFDDAFNADNRRERVRLVECWYRVPAKVQIMRGIPRVEGQIFDQQDEYHVSLVEQGYASTYDALKMIIRCAMFVGGSVTSQQGTMLQDMVSPYRHNRFPFTPIWCFRRGRDNTPYGIVRNLRDPQEDLNKRRSKALFILSTNKMVADKNAFDDWDEAAEELARPDGILKKRPGSEVQLVNETDIAERHVMMEQADAKYIQDVSGVTDENLGRQTNATSGIAIHARQDQGSLVTADVFDSLRLAIQLQGEIELSLVEQFYDQQKKIRITGSRGTTKFIQINQPQLNMKTGQIQTLNDITESQSDFKVDTQDYRESVRVAIFETLMNLCGQLPPEMTINILDLVMEMSDVPGKEEIVKRIRKINGQVDPDHQDDPQVMADLKAKQAADDQQAQLTQQATSLALSEQEANIHKLLAQVQLILEQAKTEALKREETAHNVAMGVNEFQANQRERQHVHTQEALQELNSPKEIKPTGEEAPA